ncbi:MAG: glycosyltransferase family 39 protein [Vampirovibrionales bacterium]|nr:glycosyltransferase family 39 protein [Vampirovibrionales bacterium]
MVQHSRIFNRKTRSTRQRLKTISKAIAHKALWGILIVGIALRVWGLDFGLPALSRPDENHISQTAIIHIFASFAEGHPDLNPHFFYYPSLFIYILTFLYGIYYLLGYWTGIFTDAQAFITLYYNDWTSFHYIQRALSAVSGILSIPALYALGRQLGKNRLIGLFSAFLLAITYLHVRDSHFGTTDIAATLWVILCLYHVSRYGTLAKPSDLYKSAIFAGLAATTKYPAGLVIVSVYAIYLLNFSNSDNPRFQSLKAAATAFLKSPDALKPIICATLLAAGVFILGSPYLLLNPMGAMANLLEQSNTVATDFYNHLDAGWWYHLRYSFRYGLGSIYTLSGLAGIVYFCFNNHSQMRPIHLSILAFFLLYYLANASTHYVFVRYMLPLVPVLAVYAVLLSVRISDAWCKKVKALNGKTVMVSSLLLGIVAWHSFSTSLAFNQALMQTDTRIQARDWLLGHIQPNDGVGIGLVFTHVDLPQDYKRYFLRPPSSGYDYEQHAPAYYFEPKARLMDISTNRNEYNLSTYSDVQTLRELGIRYVVLGVVTQDLYRMPQFEIDAVHQVASQNQGLRKVVEFSSSDIPTPKENYDPLDGFFVPFTQPGLVKRPGPMIEIFEVLPEKP